jgi:hypothetical protein
MPNNDVFPLTLYYKPVSLNLIVLAHVELKNSLIFENRLFLKNSLLNSRNSLFSKIWLYSRNSLFLKNRLFSINGLFSRNRLFFSNNICLRNKIFRKLHELTLTFKAAEVVTGCWPYEVIAAHTTRVSRLPCVQLLYAIWLCMCAEVDVLW